MCHLIYNNLHKHDINYYFILHLQFIFLTVLAPAQISIEINHIDIIILLSAKLVVMIVMYVWRVWCHFFLNLSFLFGDSKKIIIIRNTRYVVIVIQSVKVIRLFDRQIDQGFVSDSFNPAIGARRKLHLSCSS